MAVTHFGKILRKIRIDHNEVLLDMAEKLEVTASFLSAVENGKRNIPTTWLRLIPSMYGLSAQAAEELEQAARKQISSIRLDFDKANPKSQELAIAFARQMDTLDDDTIEQLKAILSRKEKTE